MSEDESKSFLGLAEWYENLNGERAVSIVMVANGIVMLVVYTCFLVSWVIMTVGASCLGMEEYDHCGSLEGAAVMIAFGVLLCGATILVLIFSCVLCPVLAYKPEIMKAFGEGSDFDDD